jgi:hypothetical protein
MQLYMVPGLSVAVIHHYQIAWAKGYGVIEGGSATPVTPTTLFQSRLHQQAGDVAPVDVTQGGAHRSLRRTAPDAPSPAG